MANKSDRVKGRIRDNAGDPAGVPSGYDSPTVVDDFVVPSVTIEDVDRAMVALFDSTMQMQVTDKNSKVVNVKTVFASGERFAAEKKNEPIRDREGMFVLPLISVRRTGIDQGAEDITGRGMNQSTGDVVIKRRLSSKDRLYQNIINKLGVTNQPGVAVKGGEPSPVGSFNETGSKIAAQLTRDGAALARQLGNNIYS